MRKIYVISPVYNEELNIDNLVLAWAGLVKSMNNFEFHFLPVDDGSTDTTVKMLEAQPHQLKVTVLKHSENRGPGAAFSTAFAYLATRMHSDDLVVMMEGDNTSRIETLMRMISRLINEDLDIVLASPFTYGGYLKTSNNLLRTGISTIANILIKLVLNLRGIHTFSSFFRVYKAQTLLNLQAVFGPTIIYSTGFEGVVELLTKSVYLKQSLSEVPLQLDWSLRKGKSKMKIVKTALGYFRLFYLLRTQQLPYGLRSP